MERPRGFNPVGEHAPGLPRHDAPLPGHVPGQHAPIGGDEPSGGFAVASGNPGLPDWFGVWSGRVIMVVATYLTLPIQLALYPIAGVPALVVGYVVYRSRLATGVGFDASMSSAWMAAFLALLAMMRVETGFEGRQPAYPPLRHWLRLGLLALWMFYFAMTQGDSAGTAAILALIPAVVAHFFLRRTVFWRMVWHSLQTWLWLRKA